MKTVYFRDSNGWAGETRIDIEKEGQLVIRTSRNRSGGGLTTNAMAWHRNQSGLLSHAMSFGLGSGDYSDCLLITYPSRVTTQLVRQQHEKALASIDKVHSDLDAHYGWSKRGEQSDASKNAAQAVTV